MCSNFQLLRKLSFYSSLKSGPKESPQWFIYFLHTSLNLQVASFSPLLLPCQFICFRKQGTGSLADISTASSFPDCFTMVTLTMLLASDTGGWMQRLDKTQNEFLFFWQHLLKWCIYPSGGTSCLVASASFSF